MERLKPKGSLKEIVNPGPVRINPDVTGLDVHGAGHSRPINIYNALL